MKFDNKFSYNNLKILYLAIFTFINLSSLNFINSSKFKSKKNNFKVYLNVIFEYPYSCGTWFNRGKEVCNQIQSILEKNGVNVMPSIKPYHMGEFPKEYNGEFNIYINNNGNKELLATSDSNSKYFHEGLKNFAATYYSIDEKTGEKNYFAVNPQREGLLKYVLERMIILHKKN